MRITVLDTGSPGMGSRQPGSRVSSSASSRSTVRDRRRPRLRWVLRVGSGTDTVDAAALRERGVRLDSLAGLNADAVAEQAVALLLTAAKRLGECHALVADGGWGRLPTRHLGGRTLGLVRYGAIGRLVAPMALGLGMDVIVTRRSSSPCTFP